MATHRLVYFNIPARAEPIRLAFHIGGIPFEDEKVSFQDFREMKERGDFLFNQLPVLYVNGEQYCQSHAILRYVGKLAGLYPEDPLSALKCDMIVDSTEDLTGKLAPSLHEKDEEKKLQMRQALCAEYLPFWFQKLNSMLASVGATVENPKFFLGDQISIADLAVFRMTAWIERGTLDGIPAGIIAEVAPLVSAHANLIKNYSRAASYFA